MSIYFLLFFSLIHAQHSTRIKFEDGNIYFHAADGNITFKTGRNGGIYFNKTDVTKLPNKDDYDKFVKALERTEGLYQFLSNSNFGLKIEKNQKDVDFITEQTKEITDEIVSLQQYFQQDIEDQKTYDREVKEFIEDINEITEELQMNACETNKCQHGGTCIPIHGIRFKCLCPAAFEGEACENDVNECDVENKELRCKNGGTCVNTVGGFECNCKDGFYGASCELISPVCTLSSSSRLCGQNGHCIEKWENTYDCVCDHGYQKSPDRKNPRCIDINECERNPCYPGVQCVNIPGSFQCHGCPPGWKMEGGKCQDIDECQTHPHPCDKLVECRNLMGDYYCTACPPGYTGDSKKKCVKENVCSPNNCPEFATCVANDHYLNSHGYLCVCPHGFDAVTEENSTVVKECVESENSICLSFPCFNGGTCNPSGDSYKCTCGVGYIGKNCEKASPCFSNNKCGHNGVCKVLDDDSHFCHCDHQFFGEKCEFQESMFDEHITSLKGTYEFKLEPGSTKTTRNLYFDVQKFGSYLRIIFDTFQGFDMAASGALDCTKTFANLSIFDGPSDSYPLLGTFCGEYHSSKGPIPFHYSFTTPRGLIRFEGSRGEYSIDYEVVPMNCGYRTTRSEGQLQVPDYNDTIICEWNIMAPATMVIELSVPPYTMVNETRCMRNRLVVRDKTPPALARSCESSDEMQKFISKDPSMVVKFQYKRGRYGPGTERNNGFTMSYKFVEPDRPPCGGDIINHEQRIGFSGVIKFPASDGLYPPNMDCTWIIHPAGKDEHRRDLKTKISINWFDIPSITTGEEARNFCKTDYLRIEDRGYDIFCNDEKIEDLILHTSTPIVKFHSDNEIEGKGFELQYEVSCEMEIRPPYSVRTFNFPHGQAGTCTYHLINDEDRPLILLFKSMMFDVLSVDECFDSNENSDYPNYVQIEEGEYGEGRTSKKYFCQKDIFAENSTMYVNQRTKITIVSDGNPKFKGFTFEVQSDKDCGGHFSAYVGLPETTDFSSPNYPEPYEPKKRCEYTLTPKPNQPLIIQFESFDVGARNIDGTCQEDRLILSKKLENFEKIVDTFCGSVIPNEIKIDEWSVLEFVSVSDSNRTQKGFKAKLLALNGGEGNYRKRFSNASSAVFDLGSNALESVRERIEIIVAENRQIVFKVTGLTTNCNPSKLVIRDGIEDDSKMIFESNCEITDTLFTTTNIALITFTSIGKHRVKVEYDSLLKSCGGTIYGLSGWVATSQYPLRQKDSMECYWTIAVSKGSRVEVKIEEVDYNGDYGSGSDSCSPNGPGLKIFENTQVIKNICKPMKKEEQIVYSKASNELNLYYVQNNFVESRGFAAQFFTSCFGIQLTDFKGEIQSPGYTEKLWVDSEFCHWIINVPKGNRIEVQIHDFSIPSIKGSFLHVTTLSGGILSNGTEFFDDIRKFNDEVEPVRMYSKDNRLDIAFHAYVKSSFWLSWNTIGCVQDIESPENITIKRDDIIDDVFECHYRIKAKIGKKIQLKLNKFALKEDHDPCHYRSNDTSSFIGLAVFIGLSNSTGDPYYFTCEGAENYVVETHSNEVFLFMSLKKDRFKGSEQVFLDATVEFVDADANDTCGGIINMNNKNKEYKITSPGYPSPYPDGTLCEWLFKVPEGRHIQYTLEDFRISSTQQVVENWDGGDCDSFNSGLLSIYDSKETDTESFVMSLCDNTSSPIHIYENASVVKFEGAVVSSDSNSTSGFVLTAKSVCGGVYYTKSKEATVYLEIDEPVCNVTFKNSDPKEDTVVTVQVERYINDVSVDIFKDRKFFESFGDLTHLVFDYVPRAKKELMFNFHGISNKTLVILKYGSDEKKCGGNLMHKSGFITTPHHNRENSLHCKWTLENTPGNEVNLVVKHLVLPISENCDDSYFEVEDYDQKSINRFCHVDFKSPLYFNGSKLTITLRYLPNQSDSPEFAMLFDKTGGGNTSSRIIRPPSSYENGDIVEWYIGTGLEEEIIMVKISDVYLSSRSYLGFAQYSDSGEQSLNENYDFKFTGAPSDQEFTLRYSKVLIRAVLHDMDDFTITWEPVPKNIPSPTDEVVKSCGGVLQADWTANSISRPNLSNETEIHCIWTIYRPQFADIKLNFTSLNMGNSSLGICSEYIMFLLDGEEDGTEKKYCFEGKTEIPMVIHFHYEKLEIHYISDSGQQGEGFELSYKLDCRRFEFISGSVVLTNPPFFDEQVACTWRIVSQHDKKLIFKFDALDIECDDENYLKIGNRRFCGTMNTTNPIEAFETKAVTLFYNASASLRTGFKLTISEKQTECNDGILRLDEKIPSSVIYSPNYPKKIPKSTECKYLIAVPNGHRVMLTFDPENFELDNQMNEEWKTSGGPIDYIEVRDGLSEFSKLIGNYTGHHAPSTIYSTGNSIFMRLHTTGHRQSHRFIANVSIATCGGTQIIREGEEVRIASPEKYNPPISCQWNILSFHSHFLLVKINKIDCESLTILDGNSTLSDEPCDAKLYPSEFIRSASNQLKIIFDSQKKSGGFDLIVKLSEEKCGGMITDETGEITLPGYPDNILTRLECKWHFNAGINFVYQLELQFTEEYDLDVFFDLKLYNDILLNGEIKGENFYFHSNNTIKITSMDSATLEYNDKSSRRDLYNHPSNRVPPFVVKYTKIPAEGVGCSFVIKENTTIRVDKKYPRIEACHMKIQRPDQYKSVSMRSIYHSKQEFGCDANFSPYTIISNGPILYNEKICRKTNESFIFINNEVDVYLQGLPDWILEFPDIEFFIEFMECGGYLTDFTGKITSPNFAPDQKYLPNSKCLWLIEAPSDMKIKLKISQMNVEKSTNCEKDSLTIGEGAEAEMNVLRKYCEEDINSSNNQNFEIISKSRHLTIQWVTDDNEEKSGWIIDYEFVNENNTCGYHTMGMFGVIKSPDNGNRRYLDNKTCIWDIQVPSGYHINFTYDTFDVEDSKNCEKDRLTYSEVSDYVEVLPDSSVEDQKILCGHNIPKPLETGSSRAFFDFTTDEAGNDKGFEITWKAVCGAVFTKKHGIITLAKNLEGYPMKSVQCGYVIKAEPTEVVNFRFDEIRLSHIDNISILDGALKKVFFEKDELKRKHFAIQGPVEIVFSNSIPSYEEYESREPFFRIHYKVIECGGAIHLSENGELAFEIKNPVYLYPPAKEFVCVWNITTTPDREIDINYQNRPQNQTECQSYIEMFKGANPILKIPGQFCENIHDIHSHHHSSRTPHILIKVVTGADNKHRFKLLVSSVMSAKSGCGGIRYAKNEWQSFGPPRNLIGNYPRDTECFWHIFSRDNGLIRIKSNEKVDCENDGLRIMGNVLSPFPDVCNTTFESVYEDDVAVAFMSRMGGSGVGFNISFIHVEAPCSHKLLANDSVQIFNSSEYDSCRFIINGTANDPMLVNFYTPETCEQRQIYYEERGIRNKCKHPACYERSSTRSMCNGTIVTNSRTLHIRLRLKASFDYQVLGSCNRTIHIDKYPSSLLESSGHDFHEGICITKLEDSTGPEHSKQLLIVFEEIRMGVQNIEGTCNQNYLQINAGDQVINKVCESGRPEPILTNGSTDVTLTFNTAFMDVDIYKASYFTVEMETEDKIQYASMNTSKGSMASFNGFNRTMEQIFLISPPSSKVCTLKIEKSTISNCDENAEYLKIYVISSDDQTRETKYCKIEEVTPIVFDKIQEGRQFRIHFKSQYQSISDNVGFELRWDCEEPKDTGFQYFKFGK